MTELYAHGELAGFAVLIVEDDEDAREMLVELLNPFALKVTTARDGVEGLEAFERVRPDLVVSDLYMPGGGGVQLIKAIRSRSFEEGGLTPAIAMTAGSDSEADALMAGFHCWFSKPIDLLKLVDAIRAFAAARTTTDVPLSARVTVSLREPGCLLISSVGHTRVADARMMARAVRAHLERARHRVVIDLRHNTGFDLAAPYAAQHELRDMRAMLESIEVVGGPLRSQLVTRAACALFGVHCAVVDDVPGASA